jgi:hypothetical protein
VFLLHSHLHRLDLLTSVTQLDAERGGELPGWEGE